MLTGAYAPMALDAAKLREFAGRPLSEIEMAAPTLVSPGMPLGDVIAMMRERRDSNALVVEGEHLRGIITERDVLCKFAEPDADWSRAVGEVMTPDPAHLSAEGTILDAIRMMCDHDFRTVPIVDGGTVRGSVRLGDLLRDLAESFPEEILNLPPRPDQTMDRPEGA